MIKNRLRFACVGIIGSILALVLILAPVPSHAKEKAKDCLLYTSDAADE